MPKIMQDLIKQYVEAVIKKVPVPGKKRIRKDESYEKNYLIGKYGAIPTLKSIDIFKEK